ncbi:MAG: SseB family protein [Pseudomonadota bacterium]
MDFKPENDLEKHLINAQNGEISGEQFLKDLMDMELFMPIKEDKHVIGGFQDSKNAIPLTVEDENDKQVVVLFTSPERAKSFVTEFPGYGGGLLAEFKWIIEKIGGGMGVIINPGFDVGLELEAEMLDQLNMH